MAKSGIKFFYLSGGPENIIGINCLNSSPYLSGTIVLTPFANLTAFQGGDNDLEAVLGVSELTALRVFEITGANTVGFDISDLSSNLLLFNVKDKSTVFGNISSIPGNTKIFIAGERTGANIPVYNHPYLDIQYGKIYSNTAESARIHTSADRGKTQLLGSVQNLSSNNLNYLFIWSLSSITGDVSNLNTALPNLSSLYLRGPGVTVSGNISGVPVALRELLLHGYNTVGGNISGIPANIKYFDVWGHNQLEGDLIGIPNNVEIFRVAHSGSNLYGNISALSTKPNLKYFEYYNAITSSAQKLSGSLESLGSTLTAFNVWGDDSKFTIGGNISGVPVNIQYLRCDSSGNISGNVTDIPSNSQLYYLDLEGSSTAISGNISGLPPKLVWIRAVGTNTLSGDIANVPNLSAYYNITIYGNNKISGNIDAFKNCNNMGTGTSPDTEYGINIRGDNTLTGNLSSIKNLPNLKVFHVVSEFSSVSGDISHLPSNMRNFILSQNTGAANIFTGDTANLPPKIRIFQQRGGDSITGNIADIPSTCAAWTVRESDYNANNDSFNTIYGDIKDMPRNMTFWTNYSDSSDSTKIITGDIKNLPRTLRQFRNVHYKYFYTITGDIKGLPLTLDYIDVRDYNTISGHLSSLPAINSQLRIFYVLGNNTITGDTKYFPIPTSPNAGFLQIWGNNTISGSLSTLPPQVDWVKIEGSFNKVNKYYDGTEGRGYNKKTWRTPMRTIKVAPGLSASRPFPQEHLVTLLTDLTSVSAWGSATAVSYEGVIAQSNCEAVITSLYPEVTAAINLIRNSSGTPPVTINGPITATPSFYRNFARYKTLDHGGTLSGAPVTFTRNSSATYFDSNGILQYANIDEPRFDHDPITKESKGLLIEQTSVNLLTGSDDLQPQSLSLLAGSYTLSFYSTGNVILTDIHTATVGGSGLLPVRTIYNFDLQNSGTLNISKTGTILYAQLEDISFPTSYIPTTTVSATRAQDYAIVTPISSFYNVNEGTLVVNAFAPEPGTGAPEIIGAAVHRRVATIGNSIDISQNHFSMGRASGTYARYTYTSTGSAIPGSTALFTGNTYAPEREYSGKTGLTYKINELWHAGGNGSVVSSTSAIAALPSLNRLTIGSDLSSFGGSNTATQVTQRYLNGHVMSVMYLPSYFTVQQLRDITI